MANTSKFHRAAELVARRIARSVGGDAFVEHNTGHAKVILQIAGRIRRIALACSPKDQDTALWNTEKQIKNHVRAMLAQDPQDA